MENQNTPNLELPEKSTTETTKRKRKLDLESLWTKCRLCEEAGNLENMVYLKVPFTDNQNQILYGCYEGVYFCSEICQEKFRLGKIDLFNVEK